MRQPVLIDRFELHVCQSAYRYSLGLASVLDRFEIGTD
jgi:hypothetical protein